MTQGDWLLRHLPGSELPADLGTKVLASEKFKQHKVNMGMFLGNEEKKEGKKEKKEDKERSFSTNAEATKQALKAIILLARMAMAKGQEENQVRLWQSDFPLQLVYESSSGLPSYIIIFLIFMFGLLTGAVLMWLAICPFFHRVTLVESGELIPRPTFLFPFTS